MARARRDDPLRDILLGDLPPEERESVRGAPSGHIAPEPTEEQRDAGVIGFRREHKQGGGYVPVYEKETERVTPVPVGSCPPGMPHIHEIVCRGGFTGADACPTCGCDARLERLYTLKMAARLIPASSVVNLTRFINMHREVFPPRYRKHGRKSPRRLLTEREIVKARAILFTSTNGKGGGRELILERDIAKAERKVKER